MKTDMYDIGGGAPGGGPDFTSTAERYRATTGFGGDDGADNRATTANGAGGYQPNGSYPEQTTHVGTGTYPDSNAHPPNPYQPDIGVANSANYAAYCPGGFRPSTDNGYRPSTDNGPGPAPPYGAAEGPPPLPPPDAGGGGGLAYGAGCGGNYARPFAFNAVGAHNHGSGRMHIAMTHDI